MTYEMMRTDVLNVARTMLAMGLTVGDSGSVSARVGGSAGRVLLAITPHGRYVDELASHDIALVGEEGKPVEGKSAPSGELPLHVAIYRARPDVGAVIHAHPPMSSAMSVVGRPIPPILEDQLVYLGGQIEVAPHAMPDSNEWIWGVLKALSNRSACLMANHGALTVGKDLKAAFVACQYLEKCAMAFLYATWAGQVNVLQPQVAQAEPALPKIRRQPASAQE
jgi:L-fuculose-phosphate aldolase